jgi:hypothetical protein
VLAARSESAPRSARARQAGGAEFVEVGIEIGFMDLDELAALEGIGSRLDLRTEKLQLERILAADTLQDPKRVADHLARVLVFTGRHDFLDELVLLGSQVDVSRRHVPPPAPHSTTIGNYCQCAQRRPRAQDILLQKLRWCRNGGSVSDRQWRDVRAIARVQDTALDRDYLRAQAPILGVADLLERALASVIVIQVQTLELVEFMEDRRLYGLHSCKVPQASDSAGRGTASVEVHVVSSPADTGERPASPGSPA